MKEIILNTVYSSKPNYKKYSALVSDEDFNLVNQYKWSVRKHRNTMYAESRTNGKLIYMHNLIINSKGIDHIDRNGLNNQRENLRIATHQQNQMNQASYKGKSKYKGVYWHKRANKWGCRIMFNYKSIHIGLFECEKQAGQAYNERAKQLYGDFAYINPV